MNENNITFELDYFEQCYSVNASSPLTVCLFVFGLITGMIGPISVIWFEKNCGNRFRTVLNQMMAIGSWYLLLYTILVYIPDGIRFVYGPLGELFCDFHVVTQNIIWPCLILTEDAMIVLRYILVFHTKNLGVINDDLVATVLNLSILTIAIWTSSVRRFSPGRFPLHYYLCTGKDPNNGHGVGTYLATSPKYNGGRIIMIFSLFLHLLMVPRFLYNKVVTTIKERPTRIGILASQNEQNPNNPNPRQQNENEQPMIRQESVKLFGLMTQLVALGCLLAIGIGVRKSINVEPNKWNNEDYHWIPLMFLIYAPIAISTSGLALVFSQNSRLRANIRKRMRLFLNRNQS